jgi:hypothetical protein
MVSLEARSDTTGFGMVSLEARSDTTGFGDGVTRGKA